MLRLLSAHQAFLALLTTLFLLSFISSLPSRSKGSTLPLTEPNQRDQNTTFGDSDPPRHDHFAHDHTFSVFKASNQADTPTIIPPSGAASRILPRSQPSSGTLSPTSHEAPNAPSAPKALEPTVSSPRAPLHLVADGATSHSYSGSTPLSLTEIKSLFQFIADAHEREYKHTPDPARKRKLGKGSSVKSELRRNSGLGSVALGESRRSRS
jgi:hypothetical protein